MAFDVAHDRLELAAHKLAARPEGKWGKTTTGRFDILVLARFRSTDEVSDFLQRELTGIEELKESKTFFLPARVQDALYAGIADCNGRIGVPLLPPTDKGG
jgi:DNA-binding Lrp family transcriptional regulator